MEGIWWKGFKWIAMVGALFLVFHGGLVWAQPEAGENESVNESDEVVQFDDVVVTATKTPVPVSQLTSAVEVISGEDLAKRKFPSVVDALRFSQGLAVFSSGGPGTSATVRMRGGTDTQTLVLLDGAVLNSATLGSYSFANLTPDNIERIEILRGPQSMLWGSDAMGGVINIRTKRGRGPLNLSGFFEYGSFLSLREGGSASGEHGPIDFSVSLSRVDVTGFSATNYRRGATERDAFRNWQVSSLLGLALPHDGRLEISLRWLNGKTDLDNITTPADVFGSLNESNQLFLSGNYDQPITDWWSQKLTLGRAEEQSNFLPGLFQRNVTTGVLSVPLGSPNETRTISNRLEWQHNFYLGEMVLITAGYQFREGQGENDTGLSNKIVSSHAGFAQGQITLFERVFATAGVRHDEFNVFGSATTYRVTGGYLLRETGTKVRGSYATGFRTPTINELFFPNFGNPNLGPEKSQGMDLGVDQEFFDKRLRLSAGYFWNRFRDLIVTTFDPVVCAPFSTFGFCPINIGAAVTKGWEASIRYIYSSTLPFLKGLELQAQYTNTLTRDVDTQARLPRWPVDQWSGYLRYQPIEPLWVTLAVRYVGSRFSTTGNRQNLNGYDVWSLAATYDVNQAVQVYTRVENLFDEKYEEILNAGTAVRSIFGGINVRYDVN